MWVVWYSARCEYSPEIRISWSFKNVQLSFEGLTKTSTRHNLQNHVEDLLAEYVCLPHMIFVDKRFWNWKAKYLIFFKQSER